MSNTALHTDKAPAAIGPYSQGIQAGNTIYVSGQIPIDPATGEFAGQDIKTQTRQSLTNISNILAAAGASMADVVKTTVLLVILSILGHKHRKKRLTEKAEQERKRAEETENGWFY